MTRPVLYGINNCDTVKRARAWLDAQGIDYDFHDYKKQGVPAGKLRKWSERQGWEALLNRRGTTWRKLDDDTRASVVDAESAMSVMQAHASVIKRPVVEWSEGDITVGFDEAMFAARR
jgi:arsenate reductase